MKSAHSPLFPTPRASRSGPGHAGFPAAVPSRLGFALTLTLALTLLGTFGLHAAAAPEDRLLRSPSGKLIAHITTADNGSLSWSLESGGHVVISPSPLGPVVNTVHLGRNARAGEPTVSETDETYPWRGGKRTATHRSRTYRLAVQSSDVPSPWTLEARVFDDGFAFRYRVPGSGPRQVQGDDAAWTLPAETEAWFQTNTGDYEGAYHHAKLEAIPTTTKSERGEQPVTLGPPVTAILPGVGYVLITEGNLREYSGMTLRPTGTSRLVATFEDDPAGFTLENEILSPWRVTVVAPDLNALVNSDVLPNLCEPPDPKLFPEGPHTAWIQPGRAL
ncbi:MAG: glycoside hydrolase family 97 N-terminal domain-containing protein, partial [Verrucomicrobiales bacterium]|nr:glycoside hydrolase family 97 N-terminal domain-containing protein [Verrucomicrobiales bacterium]